MISRLKNQIAQISLKVLLVIALFIFALTMFVILIHEVMFEKEVVFDYEAHHFFARFHSAALITWMKVASFFGSFYFMIPAYGLLIAYVLIKRKYRYAIDISVIALSGFGMMVLLKQYFRRSRPELPIIHGLNTYSFPSGHALSSFIFCSILGYLVAEGTLTRGKKIIYILLLFLVTLTIGISRIVLNVHYASDVLAGFCFGITWVILSFWTIRFLFPFIPSGDRPKGDSPR